MTLVTPPRPPRRLVRKLAAVLVALSLSTGVAGGVNTAYAGQQPPARHAPHSAPQAPRAATPDPQVVARTVAQVQEALRLAAALRAERARLVAEEQAALRSAAAEKDAVKRLQYAAVAVDRRGEISGLDREVARARAISLDPVLQGELSLVTRGLSRADARDVLEAVRVAQRVPAVSDLSRHAQLVGEVTAAAKALADAKGTYADQARAKLEQLLALKPADPARATVLDQLDLELSEHQLALSRYEVKLLHRAVALAQALPTAAASARGNQAAGARFPLAPPASAGRKPVLVNENSLAAIARTVAQRTGAQLQAAAPTAAGTFQTAVQPVDKPVDALVKGLQDAGMTVTRTDGPTSELTLPAAGPRNVLNPNSHTVSGQQSVLDVHSPLGGHLRLTVEVQDKSPTHALPQDIPPLPSHSELRPPLVVLPLGHHLWFKATAGIKVTPSAGPAELKGPVERSVTISRQVLADPAGEFTGPEPAGLTYLVPAKDTMPLANAKAVVNTGGDIQLFWGPDHNTPILDITVSAGQERTTKASLNLTGIHSLRDLVSALPVDSEGKLNINLTVGLTQPGIGLPRSKPFVIGIKGTPQEFLSLLRNRVPVLGRLLNGKTQPSRQQIVDSLFSRAPEPQNSVTHVPGPEIRTNTAILTPAVHTLQVQPGTTPAAGPRLLPSPRPQTAQVLHEAEQVRAVLRDVGVPEATIDQLLDTNPDLAPGSSYRAALDAIAASAPPTTAGRAGESTAGDSAATPAAQAVNTAVQYAVNTAGTRSTARFNAVFTDTYTPALQSAQQLIAQARSKAAELSEAHSMLAGAGVPEETVQEILSPAPYPGAASALGRTLKVLLTTGRLPNAQKSEGRQLRDQVVEQATAFALHAAHARRGETFDNTEFANAYEYYIQAFHDMRKNPAAFGVGTGAPPATKLKPDLAFRNATTPAFGEAVARNFEQDRASAAGYPLSGAIDPALAQRLGTVDWNNPAAVADATESVRQQLAAQADRIGHTSLTAAAYHARKHPVTAADGTQTDPVTAYYEKLAQTLKQGQVSLAPPTGGSSSVGLTVTADTTPLGQPAEQATAKLYLQPGTGRITVATFQTKQQPPQKGAPGAPNPSLPPAPPAGSGDNPATQDPAGQALPATGQGTPPSGEASAAPGGTSPGEGDVPPATGQQSAFARLWAALRNGARSQGATGKISRGYFYLNEDPAKTVEGNMSMGVNFEPHVPRGETAPAAAEPQIVDANPPGGQSPPSWASKAKTAIASTIEANRGTVTGLNSLADSFGVMVAQTAYQDRNTTQPFPTDPQITADGGIDPSVYQRVRAATPASRTAATDEAVRQMNLVISAADRPALLAVGSPGAGDNSDLAGAATVRQLATDPTRPSAGNQQAVDFARSCLTAKDAGTQSGCISQWQNSYGRQAYVNQLATAYYYNGGTNTDWHGDQVTPGTIPVLDNLTDPRLGADARLAAIQRANQIHVDQTHLAVLDSSADPSVRQDALALARQMQQDQALLKAWNASPDLRQAALDNPAYGQDRVRNLKLNLVEHGVDPNLLTAQDQPQAAAQLQAADNTARLYADTAGTTAATYTGDPAKSWQQNYDTLVNQAQDQTIQRIDNNLWAVRQADKRGYATTPAYSSVHDFTTGLNADNALRATDVQSRVIAGLQASLSGGNQSDFAAPAQNAGNQAALDQLRAQGYDVTLSPDGKSYTVRGTPATVNYVTAKFNDIAGKAAQDTLRKEQNQFEQNYLTTLADLPPLPGESRDQYVQRIHDAATGMTFHGKNVTSYQPNSQTIRLMEKGSDGATGTFGTADLGTVQHDLACSMASGSGHDNAYCSAPKKQTAGNSGSPFGYSSTVSKNRLKQAIDHSDTQPPSSKPQQSSASPFGYSSTVSKNRLKQAMGHTDTQPTSNKPQQPSGSSPRGTGSVNTTSGAAAVPPAPAAKPSGATQRLISLNS